MSSKAIKVFRPLAASSLRTASANGFVTSSSPYLSRPMRQQQPTASFSASAPIGSTSLHGAERFNSNNSWSSEKATSSGSNLGLLACIVGGVVVTAAMAETAHAEEPAAAPEVGEGEPVKKKTKKVVVRRKRKKALGNPGKLENIDMEASQVLMMEGGNGARMEVSYALQNIPNEKTFVVSLNLGLDDTLPEKKTCQVGGTVQMGDTLLYCLADVGGAGRVMGRFNFPIVDGLTCHNTAQILPDKDAAVVISDLEYKGKDFTTAAKLRMQPGSPTLEVSYFQSIFPTIAVGAALTHDFDQENALFLHGRYKNLRNSGKEGDIFTGMLVSNCVGSMSYTHKVSQAFSLATDLNLKMDPSLGVFESLKSGAHESVFRVGSLYRYNTFQFQNSIDSTGKIASELQQITSSGFTFGFAAEVNQWTNASRFGVSLKLG